MTDRSEMSPVNSGTWSDHPSAGEVLPAALRTLVEALTRTHAPALRALLQERTARQTRLDAGEHLDFRADTQSVRADKTWRVAAIPSDLQKRVVEITGPAEPKMILNALGSGADVFMADFEDSTAPTWNNVIDGQRALMQAVRGTLTFQDPGSGKKYALREDPAVLMARPRGLHLTEAHVVVDGAAIPASIFDAVTYIFHNAEALLAKGSGAYLYLPKLESHLEARWWHSVLDDVERALELPAGSTKVTVLIETLPAAFEMHEILHALRTRCVGLNCGRWDYIFSTIKRRRADKGFVLPDRARVGMASPFMRAYSQLLIQTCHLRGAFAIGGMSAFIPRKDDAAAHARAMAEVEEDKKREASDGHDGTWVAHPGLVEVARRVFAEHLAGKDNQLDVARDDVKVGAEDLLRMPEGDRTESGLRMNARVGLHYLTSWLGGVGCVAIDHKMEDAATAEISRAQLWQWLKAGAVVGNDKLTAARLTRVLDEECAGLVRHDFPGERVAEARALFERMCTADVLDEFLTLPAYETLIAKEK